LTTRGGSHQQQSGKQLAQAVWESDAFFASRRAGASNKKKKREMKF
jgi:hypothetical protein